MNLKSFIYALIALTGIPTWVMVVRPFAAERARLPQAYNTEDDPANPDKAVDPSDYKGLSYPPERVGVHAGATVYAREGCAQCHTQVIRADYAGIDRFRRDGAKREKDEDSIVVMRQTNWYDYLGEDFAMIGQRRVGPDFTNATYRFGWSKDQAGEWKQDKNAGIRELLAHFRNPQVTHSWSICPPLTHLFDEKKRETDAPHPFAVTSDAAGADSDMEIVPTEDAVNLASYLIGLRRDHAIPNSITGVKTKPKK